MVGAGGAAQPKVDTAGKQPRQRPELFGDDVGRMVGEHDAAGADADGFRSRCDMTDHDRRCGARDARHVVMLRHPDAAIATSFGMNRNIAGVVERAARIGFFGDANEIEDRQCSAIAAHAAFDPLEENPRGIDTVEAHLRSSSAMGPSQAASKVCEGPIAVIARAIDPGMIEDRCTKGINPRDRSFDSSGKALFSDLRNSLIDLVTRHLAFCFVANAGAADTGTE